MPDFRLVDDPVEIIDLISGHQRIGVDTEFMREKTFYAELCLVQIALPEEILCVDPLAQADLAAFWNTLLGETWVAHSARQDIEVIYQTAGRMPSSLFDTQVAAGLLGLAPQLGYAGLVKELFDVELPKSHTRADWSRRPLTRALLHYAAEDVEYLLPACEALSERLESLGRLEWARQDSELLLDPALYQIDPQEAIARVKGARNMRGRRRSAAARLAAWRERRAIRSNRPRQWILRDSVLLEIATRLPTSMNALAGITDMPAKLVQREGQRILDELRRSAEDDSGYRPPAPPNEQQKSALKEMQSVVAACAAELEIPAETLASKRELSAAIVNGSRDGRMFSGWRQAIVGDRLREML